MYMPIKNIFKVILKILATLLILSIPAGIITSLQMWQGITIGGLPTIILYILPLYCIKLIWKKKNDESKGSESRDAAAVEIRQESPEAESSAIEVPDNIEIAPIANADQSGEQGIDTEQQHPTNASTGIAKGNKAAVVFAIIAIIAVFVGIYEYAVIYSLQEEIKNSEITSQQQETRIDAALKNLRQKQDKISDLQFQNSALLQTVGSIKGELSFYQCHVCIVEKGSKTYHHYGCEYSNVGPGLLTEFSVFSPGNARHRGYKPCEYCWKE